MNKWFIACCFTALSALSMSSVSAAEFRLYSPDIDVDGEIDASFEYDGFGCNGDNESPELRWENAPPGTRSFAISVYDPDAPTGSGWWHWRVINIPSDVNHLTANAGAADGSNMHEGAVQIRNDYGDKGWGGLCPPPHGEPHRYIFTLHALDVETLDIPEDASPAMAGFMIHQHLIHETGFMATYARYEND